MVDVIHGSYEEQFPRVIAHLASTYHQPVPTFAFVDPRGYADNPFSHIADFKRRMPGKSEVMVYLPAAFMARFLATGITDEALTKLYGGPTWEDAKDEQSRQRAGQRLARLFGDRLGEHFDWVTSFNVEPERRNDYYLLFGTDHKDGLREMKRGMWKVDQHGGEGFKQAKTLPRQGQLFGDDSVVVPRTRASSETCSALSSETGCSPSPRPKISRYAGHATWINRTFASGRCARLSRPAGSR